VHAVTARGREYFYYQPRRGSREPGPRIRIPGLPYNIDGTPNHAWWAAYRECSQQKEAAPRAGSFSALKLAYISSPEWKNLGERTKDNWRRDLERIERAWGELSVKGLEPKHVLALRDQFAPTPAAANNLIKCLSALMSWSIPRGWRTSNPCAHIKKLKIGDGYAPWDWEDIEHFKAHAPLHLWQAAALALYTGQRLGDVLEMRWSEIRENMIAVKQNKTGKPLWIPMHRDLEPIVAALPRSSLTLLTNTRGLPWTASGFKSSWGKALNEPKMVSLTEKELVFHGLRKSAVVFLLEAGCTDAEVAAITGQSRQMVEHYAREVNQKKLAMSAIDKWETSR
jgi:integrase